MRRKPSRVGNYVSKTPGKDLSEKRKIFIRLLDEHPNMSSVADALGISKEAVRYWVKKLDIPYDRRDRAKKFLGDRWKEYREKRRKNEKKDIEKALAMLRKGHSLYEIGESIYKERHPKRHREYYMRKVSNLFRLFKIDTDAHRADSSFYIRGRKIRQLRLKKGLRQQDLGWQCLISNYEKGGMVISRKKAAEWAEKLGVTVEEFLAR